MLDDLGGGPARVLLLGALGYVALILLLRLSGKRTLAKMNAFDLVVTVALGSTLATLLLSSRVTLLEGVTANCSRARSSPWPGSPCVRRGSGVRSRRHRHCCCVTVSCSRRCCAASV
jgi:hypothetical protein